MPYIVNTPESKISRSDSKNPATTCRGITANGLPCRRALASPSPNSSPPRTTVKPKVQQNLDLAALYCWQHKDQAESILHRTTWTSSDSAGAQKPPRTSIDTLMNRLGVLDINDPQNPSNPRKQNHPNKKKKNQTRRTFCCFTIIEDDEPAPSKPKPAPRPSQSHNQTQSTHPQQMHQVSSLPPTSLNPQQQEQKQKQKPQPRNPPKSNQSIQQTNTLLKWIPKSLTPQTTSLLLTELAKSISLADEPGYIYMFWITPTTTSTSSSKSQPPPLDIASSLLPLPPPSTAATDRDVNDGVDDDESPEQIQRSNTAIRKARDLNSMLSSVPGGEGPGTVRLKIGRTSNVHRRLNEWTRQCSNHLTLIRYYPYTSSSERGQGQGQVGLEPGRKVPHVHRVERLIHIELADIRARDLGPCQECGKEHREWFEVAAERTALKRVDECIRRWVLWAHSQ